VARSISAERAVRYDSRRPFRPRAGAGADDERENEHVQDLIGMLGAPLLGSIIAASATIIAALVNLRVAWRKEVSARERGQPVTKKARRGPVFAVVVLLIASAVGGFAFSQYLIAGTKHESENLQSELRTQVAEIASTAQRLEQARMEDRSEVEASVRRLEAQRRGEEGAAASVTLPPCEPHVIAMSTAGTAAAAKKRECTEAEAVRATVCVSVPWSANVTEVVLYARYDDSTQPWAESRVKPGKDIGFGRFADKPSERQETDTTKQVCQSFYHWNAERGRSVRIVAKYSM